MGVELEVDTTRVELLDLPGVKATGFVVNEVVGPLGTAGETVAESVTVLDSPRLPRLMVVLLALPATTLREVGFTAIVKLPTTTMLMIMECLSAPLAPITVT